MAQYTYDVALSRDIDFMRFHVGDTQGCNFPTSGTGPPLALLPDETYGAVLAAASSKWEATAEVADALIGRYANEVTQFTASGQIGVTWADRIRAWQDVSTKMRALAPLDPNRYTVRTQSVIYNADPYRYLPDEKRPLPQ
jgi:hypothetical protein